MIIQRCTREIYFAKKIFNSRGDLFVQEEDLIDKANINLKLKHIDVIINAGFTLKLHGAVVDWDALKNNVECRNMSTPQRTRFENQKMDADMKSYWSKAVSYVENGDAHPDKLINQPFVHHHINKFHEVKFVCYIM